MRNIPEIKKMSTGLGSAKIHVQSSKGLCCEERRQEWKRKEDDRASPGHCSPRNNSPLTDHILKHTHTHTGVGPCHHERTTTFSYSSHLPEVFNIFSQRTKKV